jgi:BMFP domain-containing protein YqiC
MPDTNSLYARKGALNAHHHGALHHASAPTCAVPRVKNPLDFSPILCSNKSDINMALKPPPPPWEVMQQVNDLIGGSGLKGEVDKNVRSLAKSALSRLDMVSREEFDAQTEILQRTRDRVATLEGELEALTKELESIVKGA